MIIVLLILVLFTCLLIALPGLRNAEYHPLNEHNRRLASGQFAQLRHGPVHFQLLGPDQGELLVMLHGFSVPSYGFERNAMWLARQGYQVLCFDFYGRGYSARPRTDYTPELLVEQLHELISYLGLRTHFHLLGLSMGGCIAANYTRRYPEQVLSTILLAPLSQRINAGPFRFGRLGRLLCYSWYIPRMPNQQLKEFVDPMGQEDWAYRFKEQMHFKGFRYAIYSTLIHTLDRDHQAAYQLDDHPSLLVWGSLDNVLPVSQAEQLRKQLGENHQYIELPHCGHLLHHEHPDEVNQAIVNFLQQQAYTAHHHAPDLAG